MKKISKILGIIIIMVFVINIFCIPASLAVKKIPDAPEDLQDTKGNLLTWQEVAVSTKNPRRKIFTSCKCQRI